MPIILALMQATWVYAGLQILAVGVYQAPALFPWWLVAGGWLAAFWLTRLVLALAWPLRVQQAVVAGTGILAIVVALGQIWRTGLTDQGIAAPRLLTAMVIAWLWVRGILAGRAGMAYDQVYRAFINGVAMWVVLAVLATSGVAALPATFTGLLLAFFLTGLMALALAGLLATGRQEKRDTGLSLPVNRYWLLLTGAATAVIILLALLLTAVLTPETAATILSHLDPILAFLGQVLLLLVMAIAYLFFLVASPLINWLRRLASNTTSVNPQAPPDFSAWQQQIENLAVETALPGWVDAALRASLLAGGLLLAGLMFAFALRRLSGVEDEGVESEREMVGSYDLLKTQLADLIKRWRSRHPLLEPFLPLDDVGAHRAIRAIYRQFLAAAQQVGWGRAPGDTPYEYLATFQKEVPESTRALQTLTDSYTAARYSNLALSETAVSEVETSWEAIAPKLSDRRKERDE